MANRVKGNYFSKMMDGVTEFYLDCSRIEVVAWPLKRHNRRMK